MLHIYSRCSDLLLAPTATYSESALKAVDVHWVLSITFWNSYWRVRMGASHRRDPDFGICQIREQPCFIVFTEDIIWLWARLSWMHSALPALFRVFSYIPVLTKLAWILLGNILPHWRGALLCHCSLPKGGFLSYSRAFPIFLLFAGSKDRRNYFVSNYHPTCKIIICWYVETHLNPQQLNLIKQSSLLDYAQLGLLAIYNAIQSTSYTYFDNVQNSLRSIKDS